MFVGDGSYLMMNSDLYSSVISGHKLIVIVCDNGGFAVINRLQVNQGGVPFNNLIANARIERVGLRRLRRPRRGDGLRQRSGRHRCTSWKPRSTRARHSDRTTSSPCRPTRTTWTGGGAFWEVGVPEVSRRAEVRAAKAAMVSRKQQQRIGI